jgi:hypothetical protein
MDPLTAAYQDLAARVAPLAEQPHLVVAAAAVIVAVLLVTYVVWDTLAYAAIPTLDVPLKQEELAETLDAEQYSPPKTLPKDKIPCYDPGTLQFLGYAKAMTPDEVRAALLQLAARMGTRATPDQVLMLPRGVLLYRCVRASPRQRRRQR